MTKADLKVGMKVRIRGDEDDFTDHLDGQIVTITSVDCPNCTADTILIGTNVNTPDEDRYYIWIKNITEIITKE